MAGEATVRCQLVINKGNLRFQNRPGQFTADVTGTKGPTPGAIAASTTGTDVSLAQLTTPGLCAMKNLDATNWVELGAWNGATFFPLVRLLPGEEYILRLTANALAGGNTYRLKANVAACNVLIQAFEA